MKKRILVVDDEDEMAGLVGELLLDAGYDVATAANGSDALAQLEGFQPQLVITDIVMPGMEGIELISRLRMSNKRIPIIAMSGNPIGVRFLKASKLFGAVATLVKPFSNEELLESVERAI